MASVLITGFKSDEQAKEFIRWYSGQGEQDIEFWMEVRGLDIPYCDDANSNTKTKNADGHYIMNIR